MEFEQFPVCECRDRKVVRRVLGNGAKRYERQCQECGKSQAVAETKLTWTDKASAQAFEQSIADAYNKKRNEFYENQRKLCAELQQQKNAEWWAWYSEYLESDRWAKKRVKVIERDVTCRACLSAPAKQAHHLTYDHVGDEPLFDLVGVCVRCHDKITAMDRERRSK